MLLAVLREVEAQIKRGLAQRAFRVEQKGDEQLAKACVVVEERMNGRKLDVRRRSFGLKDCPDGGFIEERFPLAKPFPCIGSIPPVRPSR